MLSNDHIRPKVLSIAGFDPSGGAGILADIKTFEQHHVQGFGACTAITVQNEEEFKSLKWLPTNDIMEQIAFLTKKHQFNWVKIGLIENLEVLEKVCRFLKSENPNTKIVWDPIIKASAGFRFHNTMPMDKMLEVCQQLFLITPNKEELRFIFHKMEAQKAGSLLNKYCQVFLKSFAKKENTVTDLLFLKEELISLQSKQVTHHDKHGTGCVLSAALLAGLAQGKSTEKACKDAKTYVENFRASNKSLLGYHTPSQNVTA